MKMLKNKTRFFLKLYIVIWITLILLVLLKLLFGYYQPYVMPNDKMQMLSDFIDRNKWLEIILSLIFNIGNALLMILCSIKQWWFKKTWHMILAFGLIIAKYFIVEFVGSSTILTIFCVIGLPLIIDYKKWHYTLIAFALSNVFMFLSMWFNGNTNSSELPYLIRMLFMFDYYIMLGIEYITTNLITFKKKGVEQCG